MNNHQNVPILKPIIPIPKLKYNEIGIRSDLKGFQIKNLIDKIIFFLIYKKYPTVTLKSRGKGIQKLISIIDILQRKILGLYVKQKTYSTSYVNNIDPNKEVKLPCMDSILTLNEPNDKNEVYLPLRKIEELENNFIDPKNPPDFRTIKGNNINYNNNNNNNNNNNYNNNYNNNIRRGRGRGRIINRVNRGNLSFRPGFRGRGKLYRRGNRGRDFKTFRNNNNYGNLNNSNFSRRGQMRGTGIRKFNRENNNIGFSNRNEDEDYREFKGYNNMSNNNFNRSTGNFNFNQNNSNFKRMNRTENNFYSNKNQSINNNINNFRNMKNNTPNNINNNINEKNNNNNNNNNDNNSNNNNNNDNNSKITPNSNTPNRGRGGIPILRGRGQVLQMLGRGLPMRGKINNNENENGINNLNGK